MGRLPRRIWYGLHLVSSGAKDITKFIKKMDREWEGQRWTTKAVLYPYHRSEKNRAEPIAEFGYRLISDLKRQGFILKAGRNLSLTEKGILEFKKITAILNHCVPIRHYAKQPGKDLVIISFDIPEKEHGKRDWLRKILVQIGLKFYHQSLWMGYVMIPEDFLHDLAGCGIDRYLAIFTVGKHGTLRKIF